METLQKLSSEPPDVLVRRVPLAFIRITELFLPSGVRLPPPLRAGGVFLEIGLCVAPASTAKIAFNSALRTPRVRRRRVFNEQKNGGLL